MTDVKKILKHISSMLQVLPTSRRRMLYERLRMKIAEDIIAVMGEQDCDFEYMAKRMGLKKDDLREWIWTRDLKLSELARLLDCLDSEFYPIIRPRKLTRSL